MISIPPTATEYYNGTKLFCNRAQLQLYADAVSLKGAALNNCFGFIDGTVRPICRPGEHQRMVYNGHKRIHALKFQSIALPNGLIANMYGPVGKYVWYSGILFFEGAGIPHSLYKIM